MHNELEIIFDYVDAGFRVLPLHEVKQGQCQCDLEHCQNAGKHPSIVNWQNVPDWSEEQLENLCEYSITTGFGVLVENYLVVDVDPRNGGDASLEKLNKDLGLDLENASGFVVQTGGYGLHIYFSNSVKLSCVQSLPVYKGIDFKTSGFVVGSGSLHANGNLYEVKKGDPSKVASPPAKLADLIKRKEVSRAVINGIEQDVTLQELKEILDYIKDFDSYENWIEVGMALHHSTQGGNDGLSLWAEWASQSDKYDPNQDVFKWHSFGKTSRPITLGTLIFQAEQNGYSRSVTFDIGGAASGLAEVIESKNTDLPFDVSHCDPFKPIGFTGKVAEWINQQGFYPRERLAAAAALQVIGNAAGLFWQDDVSGVTSNLLTLLVAGSGTGKEAVQDSVFKAMQAINMATCVHGDIKSKQEITRNLIANQAAFYLTDEIGEILKGIESAKKKGGAPYLEGVTGDIMKIFTKADSVFAIGGDVFRDLEKELVQQLAKLQRDFEDLEGVHGKENEANLVETRIERLQVQLDNLRINGGLDKPFLSLLGFTTLESLEPALSIDLAKNGFLNRAFIVEERDTNPKPNKKFKPSELPFKNDLLAIATAGNYESVLGARIEHTGAKRDIKTEPRAKEALLAILDWQWYFAEHHKKTTGYEALARRAHEFVSKVSFILAVADNGLRTIEHVKWAARFVKHDIDEKIRLIQFVEARDNTQAEVVSTGYQAKIISLCQEPQYKSVVIQRLGRSQKANRQTIGKLIAEMAEAGVLEYLGSKVVAKN